jgi:P pilus assembly chaperone PapD
MTHTAALLIAAAFMLCCAAVRPARAAQVGGAAPLFEADSSAGRIALADFQGKKNVLVAFYFKDFTGG